MTPRLLVKGVRFAVSVAALTALVGAIGLQNTVYTMVVFMIILIVPCAVLRRVLVAHVLPIPAPTTRRDQIRASAFWWMVVAAPARVLPSDRAVGLTLVVGGGYLIAGTMASGFDVTGPLALQLVVRAGVACAALRFSDVYAGIVGAARHRIPETGAPPSWAIWSDGPRRGMARTFYYSQPIGS